MRFIYSKIFAWFVIALCVTAIVVFVQTRGWFGPIQKFFLYLPRPVVVLSKGMLYPVRDFVKNVYSIGSIVRQNAALETKVARLEQEVVSLHAVRSENELLKKETGFADKSPFELEPCTVLAQDPEGVTGTLVLNCGASSGIKSGQAVIAQGFLVGKVFIVNTSTSTVKILANPDLSIDAKISSRDTAGLVKGSFGSGVFMDLIAQSAIVTPGDLIVTAGINDLIPKNILIGEVGDLVTGPNDLFKKITVRSPIDLRNLDYVYVVK